MGPEALVERGRGSQSLGVAVRRMGGLSYKIAPTTAGLPDRLVILPGGRIFLIETKAPKGRLRPVQRVIHQRLALRGVTVHVLWSKEQVKDWVDSVSSGVV